MVENLETQMLEVSNLASGYGEIQVLDNVTLTVPPHTLTALVGPNGAGKSTLLKTISGLIRPSAGSIHFAEEDISGLPPETVVARGVVLVPEGRGIFPNMTVLDNLRMGAYLANASRRWRQTIKEVFELFPILQERVSQKGRTLSGGEAQMLAVGRGLMSLPSLIMLDEPSLGLAPKVVTELFDVLKRLPQRDMTVFVVEQNVRHILSFADKGYVLARGKVVGKGTGKELLESDVVHRAFLGL
jgi:branched-chain amino acid transport system ATP-binding protein